MGRNRGRRFDDEPKLNKKKVAATIIALLVIVMVVASIILSVRNRNNNQQVIEKPVEYFSAYTGSKWTVINSKGEEMTSVVSPEMIVVPNKEVAVFIVTENIDYINNTYKTKAVNEKNEQLFGNYQNVNAIANYSSVDDVWYDSNVLTFQKDGKYGLIDYSGNQVLGAEYDEISAMQGIMRNVIVKKGEQVGLFNTVSKTMTINPEYSSIKPLGETYNEGYIVCDANNKYGLLGSDGKRILENNYDEILNAFGSDKYVVKVGNKTQLISSDGTMLLDSGFDEIVSINAENMVISKNKKYGVISTAGESIIDTIYDSVKYCFADYYIVSTNGKYGIINSMGEFVIEAKYNGIEYRSDIASLVCENEDYTTDVYTREFKLIFTGTINKVDTDQGYIRVRIGDEYKYYNLQYQEISNKEALKDNTLFLVKENGKYGYVNKDNQKIVDCIYDDAQEQNEYGYCAVKKDGKWGALQSNGAVILAPSYELENNLQIDFIGVWHLSEYAELNAYTK